MVIVSATARSSSPRGISFDTDFSSAWIRWGGSRAALLLDDVKSSAVDTLDLAYLELEYMQHMDAAVSSLRGPQDRFRTLHVNGVACTLTRAWSSSRPNSRHVAVEVDRPLVEQVREHFPISGVPQARIRVGDGRTVLGGVRGGSFGVIVHGTFVSGVIPDHLRTVGCVDRARCALAASGVYLINCAHEGLASACQDVAALQEVFPFVASIRDPKAEREGRHGSIVTLASTAGVVDVDQIDRALHMLALPARTTRPIDLTRWVAGMWTLIDSLMGYPQAD